MYCEQMVPFRQFLEHQEKCGSKTQLCVDCAKNVCNKDMRIHKELGECLALKNKNQRDRREEQKMEAAAQGLPMPNLQPSLSNAGADLSAVVGEYDEATAIAI